MFNTIFKDESDIVHPTCVQEIPSFNYDTLTSSVIESSSTISFEA